MIAYISLSIPQKDLYIYTFLSKILIDKGFIVLSNYNVNQWSKVESIKKANLFYGLILRNGGEPSEVISDYAIAHRNGVTSFILTEQDLQVTQNDRLYNNIFKIDKRNYQATFDYLSQHLNNIVIPKVNREKNGKAFMWMLGAAGAIALLSALSEEKAPKKKRRIKN